MRSKAKLTKEEVSELSQALSAVNPPQADPTPDGEQVRSYDFDHPDKLSKSNMRALQLIFSSLERPWASTASAALRTDIAVRVGSLEQSRFGAYAEALAANHIVAVATMEPLPGASFLDIPATLALSVVDRLTGGKGDVPGEPRELTQIELGIVKRFLNRLCADISAAWAPIESVEFNVSELYQSAEEIAVEPKEPVIVAETTWNVRSTEHKVNIALRVSSLDSILSSLNPHRWRQKDVGPESANARAMADLLDPVSIEMTVELGNARVSMRDLLSMGVGDVIRLNRTVNDSLDVKVGKRLKFYGRPGLVGRRVSVQIKDLVRSEVGRTDEKVVGPAVNREVSGSDQPIVVEPPADAAEKTIEE